VTHERPGYLGDFGFGKTSLPELRSATRQNFVEKSLGVIGLLIVYAMNENKFEVGDGVGGF
jgi:hypothetical protein